MLSGLHRHMRFAMASVHTAVAAFSRQLLAEHRRVQQQAAGASADMVVAYWSQPARRTPSGEGRQSSQRKKRRRQRSRSRDDADRAMSNVAALRSGSGGGGDGGVLTARRKLLRAEHLMRRAKGDGGEGGAEEGEGSKDGSGGGGADTAEDEGRDGGDGGGGAGHQIDATLLALLDALGLSDDDSDDGDGGMEAHPDAPHSSGNNADNLVVPPPPSITAITPTTSVVPPSPTITAITPTTSVGDISSPRPQEEHGDDDDGDGWGIIGSSTRAKRRPAIDTEGATSSASEQAGAAEGESSSTVGALPSPPPAPFPDGPKLLADLVEAVLGAVLVDSGGDLVEVWGAYRGLVEAARGAGGSQGGKKGGSRGQ